jgi:hypothetical protein
MENIDNEINNILFDKLESICKDIYSRRIDMNKIYLKKSVDSIVDFSIKNRLDFYLFSKYAKTFDNSKIKVISNTIINEYENYKNKLKNSINIIKKYYKTEDFVIVKTFSSFPHKTTDLDVVVKKMENVSENVFKREDCLSIDISDKIDWGGIIPIDNNYFWKNLEVYLYDEIEFFIPNKYLDTLIRIGHIPFELAHIKLGELLHIFKQGLDINWEILKEQAKLMGWYKTFNNMLKILDELHACLFGKYYFYNEYLTSNEKLHFPYKIPVSLIVNGVIEKRAWKKIWGARYLIKDWIIECIRRKTY